MLSILLILINCAGKNIEIKEDLTPQFNKALNLFNKGKYARSKEEFQYIIMTDPGSKIANESQYYKAEAPSP